MSSRDAVMCALGGIPQIDEKVLAPALMAALRIPEGDGIEKTDIEERVSGVVHSLVRRRLLLPPLVDVGRDGGETGPRRGQEDQVVVVEEFFRLDVIRRLFIKLFERILQVSPSSP